MSFSFGKSKNSTSSPPRDKARSSGSSEPRKKKSSFEEDTLRKRKWVDDLQPIPESQETNFDETITTMIAKLSQLMLKSALLPLR